mgnify:CR=1 FL=1
MDIYIIIGLVIIALAILGVGWLWITYNTLVKLKVRVEAAWSDVTIQLKRRADLIPNVVETVKGYASHERGVYEAVAEARASIMSASTPADAAKAEGQLEGALKSLFAVAEAYPDLKASTNFLQLQADLVDTEDKVMASRRFYNAGVRDFNTSIRMFPTSLIAGYLSFAPQEFFDVEDAASIANPPSIQF